MKTHIPSPTSWEGITTAIKQHFQIKCLSKSQAQAIMKLYLTGMPVEDMIKQLKEEMK